MRQLQVALDGKSLQEYPVKAGVPRGPILGPKLFLLNINDLPDDFICNIAIYTNDTTLYSKCNQASDMWQQKNIPYAPFFWMGFSCLKATEPLRGDSSHSGPRSS